MITNFSPRKLLLWKGFKTQLKLYDLQDILEWKNLSTLAIYCRQIKSNICVADINHRSDVQYSRMTAEWFQILLCKLISISGHTRRIWVTRSWIFLLFFQLDIYLDILTSARSCR